MFYYHSTLYNNIIFYTYSHILLVEHLRGLLRLIVYRKCFDANYKKTIPEIKKTPFIIREKTYLSFLRGEKRMPAPESIRDPSELPSTFFPLSGTQGVKVDIVISILLIYAVFTYVLMFWPRRSMAKVYETIVKLTGNLVAPFPFFPPSIPCLMHPSYTPSIHFIQLSSMMLLGSIHSSASLASSTTIETVTNIELVLGYLYHNWLTCFYMIDWMLFLYIIKCTLQNVSFIFFHCTLLLEHE